MPADQGYDPTYGARPLKRLNQKKIQNPLASELFKGNLEEGAGVRVDFQDDEFTFGRSEGAAPSGAGASIKTESVG